MEGYSLKEKIQEIEEVAKKMRQLIIKLGYRAGNKGAHFGASLSSVEIMACLYHGIMRMDAKNPSWKERDVFIPGKGHCAMALYTSLALAGFFPSEELDSYDENGSDFMGHPVMNINRGIEVSSGSLGMALSQGVGVSLAIKRKNQKRNTFVLLGDGECQEGAVWEAAMSASHYELNRLIVIVDRNRLQYDGETEEIMTIGNIGEKFQAFGFETYEVDGHNVSQLFASLQHACNGGGNKPKVIIAHTIKGKGISFMENKKEWHNNVLTKPLYMQAMEELGGVMNEL